MKEKITDLAIAMKDESIQALLESETLGTLIKALVQQVIKDEAGALVGSILSAASPRVHGMWLSFKQNRFERNMTRMMAELFRSVDDLKIQYAALSDEMKDLYNGQFTEMLLDNVVDEQQIDKVTWNVNGFIGMMTNDANENIMKMFFDTLNELTVLDIELLKAYRIWDRTYPLELAKQYGIDSDQLKMVKEKLVRLGLMNRKNDEQRDKNLDEIVEYLEKSERDAKSSKPKGVKLPYGIKKISNTESYEISHLGFSFLASIGEGR